ncbi:MAG: ABC transporter permease [Propioniciclava sp.]
MRRPTPGTASPSPGPTSPSTRRQDQRKIVAYVAGQLVKLVTLVVAVSALTVILIRLAPIDPVTAYFGSETVVDPVQRAQLVDRWGLEDPAIVQLGRWWFEVIVHQDMGTSLTFGRPVADVIASGLWNSALLLAAAWLISGLLGGLLGLVAAHQRGRLLDKAISTGCYLSAATPTFWVGMIVLLIFSVRLGWFPIGFSVPIGQTLAETSLTQRLEHILLPALTLSLVGVSTITLQTRTRLIEVLDSDMALFSRSRGLTRWQFITRHGLRNAAMPFITLQFGSISEIIGGSVLAESVFSYAGLGSITVQAGTSADLPLLLGITVCTSAIVFLGNMIANLCYPLVDRRVTEGSSWA